ncbi:MAG: hypothetical protein WAU65_00080 [Candidatus Nanoarchaeia archaeon]
MGKLGGIGLIIYIIFGLYFLNIFFNLISLPFSPTVNSYLALIAGFLLIIGGIFFFKANRFR